MPVAELPLEKDPCEKRARFGECPAPLLLAPDAVYSFLR
jgi:hypothetical protein